MEQEITRALGVFFTLAVIFEVALTPIFTWRVYLTYLDGKGFKMPIATILAYIFCSNFDLDILAMIMKSIKEMDSLQVTFVGQLITALLIAGGSSGINQIFAKLGVRNPEAIKDKVEAARAELEEKKAANKK